MKGWTFRREICWARTVADQRSFLRAFPDKAFVMSMACNVINNATSIWHVRRTSNRIGSPAQKQLHSFKQTACGPRACHRKQER